MAGDAEDLGIVSAYLQDGVIKLGDFGYLAEKRRFAFVANRFVWEAAGKRQIGPFHRVRCGVHFDDISDVKFQYLKTDAKDAIVELLSIDAKADGETWHIELNFAGGGAIRLHADCINLFISDLSEPWRTRSRPQHKD